MASLDELRRTYPHLGFAVYALTPGGLVTLEIVAPDSQVFTFEGPTLASAVAVAFPPEPTPAPTVAPNVNVFE